MKELFIIHNNNNNNNNNIYALIERISMLNALYVDKKKKENKKALQPRWHDIYIVHFKTLEEC